MGVWERTQTGTPARFSTFSFFKTEVMQKFCFFSWFSFAYVFNVLSIQGVHIKLSSRHVYNETSDMAARQMFKKFVKTHNRTYVSDPEEYSKRLAVFKVILL